MEPDPAQAESVVPFQKLILRPAVHHAGAVEELRGVCQILGLAGFFQLLPLYPMGPRHRRAKQAPPFELSFDRNFAMSFEPSERGKGSLSEATC